MEIGGSGEIFDFILCPEQDFFKCWLRDSAKCFFLTSHAKQKTSQFFPAEGRVLSRTRKKNQLGRSVCLFVCLFVCQQKSTPPVWFEKTLNIVSKYHKFCNILNVFF